MHVALAHSGVDGNPRSFVLSAGDFGLLLGHCGTTIGTFPAGDSVVVNISYDLGNRLVFDEEDASGFDFEAVYTPARACRLPRPDRHGVRL